MTYGVEDMVEWQMVERMANGKWWNGKWQMSEEEMMKRMAVWRRANGEEDGEMAKREWRNGNGEKAKRMVEDMVEWQKANAKRMQEEMKIEEEMKATEAAFQETERCKAQSEKAASLDRQKRRIKNAAMPKTNREDGGDKNDDKRQEPEEHTEIPIELGNKTDAPTASTLVKTAADLVWGPVDDWSRLIFESKASAEQVASLMKQVAWYEQQHARLSQEKADSTEKINTLEKEIAGTKPSWMSSWMLHVKDKVMGKESAEAAEDYEVGSVGETSEVSACLANFIQNEFVLSQVKEVIPRLKAAKKLFMEQLDKGQTVEEAWQYMSERTEDPANFKIYLKDNYKGPKLEKKLKQAANIAVDKNSDSHEAMEKLRHDPEVLAEVASRGKESEFATMLAKRDKNKQDREQTWPMERSETRQGKKKRGKTHQSSTGARSSRK